MLAASAAARCMLVDISAGDGALLFDRCRGGSHILTDALGRLPDGFERRYNISRDAVERSDFFGDLVGGLLRLIGRILDLGCHDGKSRPASPARADSIVALSANKLICPVMSPMIWTMPLIASAAELSRFACSSAFATRRTASFAVSFDLSKASENLADGGVQFFRTGRDLLHHPAHFFTLHARNDLSGGVGWVFHDLERPSIQIEDRIVGGLNPDFLATLADPLVFAGLIPAAIEAVPELAISGAVAFRRLHKRAVVLARDFAERIARRIQEIGVGGADRAVHVELDNGFFDFPIASMWPAKSALFNFWSVTSVATFTTLKGFFLSSRTGL
jgi:hypothetical protein